jgi:hypothetical protein
MKKLYFVLAATLFAAGTISAQCTPDINNTDPFSPTPDNVPTATIGVAYNEVLQFFIPATRDITVVGQTVTAYIDSVVLNDVTGLPAGLTWSSTPAGPTTYLPNTHGCGLTTGTTTAGPGNYPIVFDGKVYFNASAFGFNIDTNITIQQFIQQEYGNTYSINVVDPNGIRDFNSELSAALSVFPNPSNGVFEVRVNSYNRVNGTLTVVDVTGKTVFSQNLDVTGLYSSQINLASMPKGIYTLQLKTAEGFAAKNISIQ